MVQMEMEQEVTSPLSTGHQTDQPASATPAILNNKKRKEKVPLVDSEVRRSCRLQKLSKGFKQKTCTNKNCLACHALPPLLPAKVVKSLNTSFCKVPAKDTSEELLSNKPKKIKSTQAAKVATKEKEADKGSKATS